MSHFQFKKFSVKQNFTPAKVTTDATVFASIVNVSKINAKVLEVGAGTGVVSLMLAQRFPNFIIDAVEINKDAFFEAQHNFENSPWADRLQIELEDFQNLQRDQCYDVIVSNPPFFNNNLRSTSNLGKNLAYHTDSLPFSILAEGIALNLKQDGEVHIMLPEYEMTLFEQEMKIFDFSCHESIHLRHSPGHKILRTFSCFKKGEIENKKAIKQVYIRDDKNNFHPGYIELMRDFLTIF